MITGILMPIVAVIIALLLIPVIYYYCIGMFDGMKGHNIFFKFGYLKCMLNEGIVHFWEDVLFGRDEEDEEG